MLLEIGLFKKTKQTQKKKRKNKYNNDGNFTCCYLVVLHIGNLQMLLDIYSKQKKRKRKRRGRRKENQNCIKSGLSQFLFLQQKK